MFVNKTSSNLITISFAAQDKTVIERRLMESPIASAATGSKSLTSEQDDVFKTPLRRDTGILKLLLFSCCRILRTMILIGTLFSKVREHWFQELQKGGLVLLYRLYSWRVTFTITSPLILG